MFAKLMPMQMEIRPRETDNEAFVEAPGSGGS
jgi:hypothetical protein